MSGDDFHSRPQRTDPARDSASTVEPLLRETPRGEGAPAQIMSSVLDELPADDGDLEGRSEAVTASMDALLVALVALRDDGTHGTGLMEDLTRLFGVEPSPGTVYPRLHDLESAGVLARHDLVQTKQYSISDREAAASTLERAATWHLAVGLFLRAALED